MTVRIKAQPRGGSVSFSVPCGREREVLRTESTMLSSTVAGGEDGLELLSLWGLSRIMFAY